METYLISLAYARTIESEWDTIDIQDLCDVAYLIYCGIYTNSYKVMVF